ncbi:hypothetical protein JVU11DRAFT_10767 [Chiua virens]|nr:hypothetical protein JVU11DRAFT_10767 [Chiua virens]
MSLAHVALAFDGASLEGVKMQNVKKPIDVDEGDPIDEPELEDHARLRCALVQALLKLNCKWASRKLFPWKGLPTKLAKSSIVCHNFPDNVPFPGAPSRNKVGLKGISDLTLAKCNTLLATLIKSSPTCKMYFTHEPQQEGIDEILDDLKFSRLPVIIGAAPDHDSSNTDGRRKKVPLSSSKHFANTSHCKVIPLLPSNVIDLSDSEDGQTQGKAKSRCAAETISLSNSDAVQIITPGPPQVLDGIQTHCKSHCTTVIVKALAKTATGESEAEILDISLLSGSEYMLGDGNKNTQHAMKEPSDNKEVSSVDESIAEVNLGRSRKCKSKLKLSDHVTKWRMVVEVPPMC